MATEEFFSIYKKTFPSTYFPDTHVTKNISWNVVTAACEKKFASSTLSEKENPTPLGKKTKVVNMNSEP